MQQLLRSSVLDAVHLLLDNRDWSRVTVGDVAKTVGISRQTIYNEFGSRIGLAQAYALRLADAFVDHVGSAIAANEGDVHSALHSAIGAFLLDAMGNPMIRSILVGEPNPELLRLVTVGSETILVHAAQRLDEVFRASWVQPPAHASKRFARVAVRIAMSYIAMPPETGAEVAQDFAGLLSPFVDALLAEK